MFRKQIKKIDIIKNLSRKTGLPSIYSKKLVSDLIEVIISNIKKDNLNLKNVGSFKLIKKRERLGRNPKTGKEFLITSRKSIKFVTSTKIIKKINELKWKN